MKNLKKYKMVIIWLLVILIGTAITVIGGYKFTREISKKDELRKVHIVPDFLLFDADLELTLEDKLRDEILERFYSTTVLVGGDIRKVDNLSIFGNFNEELFKQNEIAKKNYSLSEDIYKRFKSLNVVGRAKSKDNSTLISFKTNNNNILLTDQADDLSYIKVVSYNKNTNRFKIQIRNIQLAVKTQTLSKYILDLTSIDFTILLGAGIRVEDISNCFLKTNQTGYFQLYDIQKGELLRNAKLKSLV